MEVGEMYDRFQLSRTVKDPSLVRLYYMMPYFPGFLGIPGNKVYYAFLFSLWF